MQKHIPWLHDVRHCYKARYEGHYIDEEELVTEVAVVTVASAELRRASVGEFATQPSHPVLVIADGAEGGAIYPSQGECGGEPEEDGAERDGKHRGDNLSVRHQRRQGVYRRGEEGIPYGGCEEEYAQEDAYRFQIFHLSKG